ncbi:uncharacterized protein LOC9306411 [Arabidopsis lyrata subsp. lyrata]|uniref:uncharacterized protein LOC9306411 n=1 Tax=Arabidopsis lyrata subsp. lyrata TaxID=81972 RepID=UPI000A29C073|nr:uncharacterized protein LOC9306411 [Arabidopsis lyrata subsp. lyrata]|eukprot:XP_020872150.1 uncharacterized protein LOC9306411 [Arabidopsis lyrata subsp. lyrata]
MTSNIYNPKVKFPQFSSTRIHIQIGNDFIQAGWTVGQNQCYNTMCPVGITMVRSDFPLGLVEISNVRGSSTISFETFGLLKDKINDNGWLEVAKEKIGFWPAKLFQQTSANNVEWGGEVYSASMPIPQMGCGYIPVGRVRYDSILCNITLIDENFNVDDLVKNRQAFSDIRGYKVVNDIYSDIPVNNIVYYGGPGHN